MINTVPQPGIGLWEIFLIYEVNKMKKLILRILSYILVAALASVLTLGFWGSDYSKIEEIKAYVDQYFIGEADMSRAEDAAAAAMIYALGDKWSYYISAEEYASYEDNKNNAYVGIGITIVVREDGTGEDITQVSPGSSAQEAGILPGDILIKVNGQAIAGMDSDQVAAMVRGEEGTSLTVTVLRDGAEKDFTLKRQTIQVQVATAEMLDGNIGLIQINNFNANCAKETIAAIEELQKLGATKLIFDVRNNPGGYVDEMLEILDYLLPEGVIFRDLDYRGNEGEEKSDKSCLELPMAVLVNGNSYSAAEFFAACLQEKQWAAVVGENTTGKGHFQNTFRLSDGSAINISTGKYFTPNGVNLTDTQGIVPNVVEKVDEETAALIYADAIPAAQDPQIQAAVKYLQEKKG